MLSLSDIINNNTYTSNLSSNIKSSFIATNIDARARYS